MPSTQLGLGCEASRVRCVANASRLHVDKYPAEPAQVEAALLRHVLHQMATTGGQHRYPLPMQFPDLGQPRILPIDLGSESLGDQVEVGQMQEKHWTVESFPKVAFGGKLRVQ